MSNTLLSLVLLALLAGAPLPLEAQTDPEVLDRIEVLTEEVRRLREQMAIPETDAELKGSYGLGPAASKVYGITSGLSLGGYGEFYFEAPLEDTETTGAVNVTDFYRFITYFGYKFSPSILMNAEIEWEHATTSSNFQGKSGSVSVEFAYLEFLIHRAFNVRAGNLLVPVGITNAIHEPPFYRGNFRPEVERALIPSTWRENGVAVHGQLADQVRYTLMFLNGFNGSNFTDKGFRGGRQKGNRAIWEDVGGVARLDADLGNTASVGGSVYVGGSDQGAEFNGTTVGATTVIGEAHVQVRHQGFEGRALVAVTSLDEDAAEAMTLEIFPEGDSTRLIPSGQLGFYVEGAFDVAPHIGAPASLAVLPWVRFESYDLQSSVPTIDGRSANDALAVQTVTVGLEVKPNPNVVLKADFTAISNDADAAASNPLRVGAGFVF